MKELDMTTDFDRIRSEILAEDLLRAVPPVIEQYVIELKTFAREGLVRGFQRSIIRYSTEQFYSEIMGRLLIVEDTLAVAGSEKARIMEYEIQALKTSLDVFIKKSEQLILEEPAPARRMYVGSSGGVE